MLSDEEERKAAAREGTNLAAWRQLQRDTQAVMLQSAAAEAKRVAAIKKKLGVKKVGRIRMKIRKVKILADGQCYVRSLAHQAYVRNPVAFRVFLLKKLGLWLPASRQWNFATVSLKDLVWEDIMYV